jgi:hypothetical protein
MGREEEKEEGGGGFTRNVNEGKTDIQLVKYEGEEVCMYGQ